MTTEYRVHLDRETCEGVFACLVRDGRFEEATDGLATLDAGRETEGRRRDDGQDGTEVVTFQDGRLDDARGAARACPVDAIDVVGETDASETVDVGGKADDE